MPRSTQGSGAWARSPRATVRRSSSKSVFDDLQAQLATNRSEFYRALPSGPFSGFNRSGDEPSEAITENWWPQGMMGGAKAHYDGIVAFSQTEAPTINADLLAFLQI